MITAGSVYSGWLDSSIAHIIRDVPGVFSRYNHILVTRLDSNTDLRGVLPTIAGRLPGVRLAGEALLFPAAVLLSGAPVEGVFVGFDEIWWFGGYRDEVSPADVSVMPPPSYGSMAPPAAVVDWMRRSGCGLALGDGFGVNYVTSDPEVHTELANAGG